jgi:hypothetical protein
MKRCVDSGLWVADASTLKEQEQEDAGEKKSDADGLDLD